MVIKNLANVNLLNYNQTIVSVNTITLGLVTGHNRAKSNMLRLLINVRTEDKGLNLLKERTYFKMNSA